VKELRRKQQMEHQTEYEQMLISEKQLIKTWRGGHMKEEIGDEVTTPYKFPINTECRLFPKYFQVNAWI
jgi:hypothetical protein